MKNLYYYIADASGSIQPVVLATLTETAGSTPRKQGSSVLFSEAGLLAGTIGGGALENRIWKISRDSLKSGKSGLYHFDLDYDIEDREEAICGGEATVLVDSSPCDHAEVFRLMRASLANNNPGALVTMVIKTGNEEVDIRRFWYSENTDHGIPPEYFYLLVNEIRESLLGKKQFDSRMINSLVPEAGKNISFFIQPFFPRTRLIIAGAGHIGKALAHQAQMLEFEVTIIDDRPEYANPSNIPDGDYFIVDNVGAALRNIEKNGAYITIVTRGHKDDAEALKACIGSGASYIGMIGSRNKTELMRNDFIINGWATDEEWRKIYAPIGLDIKSETVEEIAISIAAQLVLIRNQKK
jgi:xanthine dehydrogenase accessory factor